MKLIKGDCLEVLKQLEDNSVDMVLTDPPYGTTACKWDTVIPFEPMWEQLHRVTKDNGAICLFGSEPFSSALRMSNIKRFKYDWVWNKLYGTNIYEANKRPLKYHELISVFYASQPLYRKQMRIALKKNQRDRKKNYKKETINSVYGKQKKYIGKKDDSKRNPISILKHSNQSAELHRTKRLHPTQKPVALLEYLIKTYTLENEIVLDFTMGSGSTGVACKNLNRNFIGIEQDDKYFRIAQARIAGDEELARSIKNDR
jgi:DNA modification methylase